MFLLWHVACLHVPCLIQSSKTRPQPQHKEIILLVMVFWHLIQIWALTVSPQTLQVALLPSSSFCFWLQHGKRGTISSNAWQPATPQQQRGYRWMLHGWLARGAVQLTEKNRVELAQKQCLKTKKIPLHDGSPRPWDQTLVILQTTSHSLSVSFCC